jgi:CBS domain-containing protein
MMGAALGVVEAQVLPDNGPGYWAILSMAAVLGGTMRSPLTAVIFALELTHDYQMMAPLLTATVSAYAVTALVMKRSILTEKISRRGLHLSREYAVDPLELHFVREVMQREFVTLSLGSELDEVIGALQNDQEFFPVTDENGDYRNLIPRALLAETYFANAEGATLAGGEQPQYVHPDQTLRMVAHRMVRAKQTRLLVRRNGDSEVIGLIALPDLLKAYERNMHLEETRDRQFTLIGRSRSTAVGSGV